MARPLVIELRGVCKQFGDTRVLTDVSLSVETGAIVVIIGPSGAGKSTLLRCINLLELPDAGHVLIEGATAFDGVRRARRRELLAVRRRLGMVFQDFNLFPHLTAVENVQLGLTHGSGVRKREALKQSMHALDTVGLASRPLAYPEQLSGGQRQRVGIARALALRPAALLLDEPTSSLDPELAGGVLDVVRDLASEGMTMVITTHELDFARDVADAIVFMDRGRVVEMGTPDQVLNAPQLERTREFLARYHSNVAGRQRD